MVLMIIIARMIEQSWNSTGKIGRIGRHRAETHRHFNIRLFGQMPPDTSDFPGGIPALRALSTETLARPADGASHDDRRVDVVGSIGRKPVV